MKYTVTFRGRVLKRVPCENCSAEYVYILEREGSGVGTSLYHLNNDGAADHAESAAEETLAAYLENDFDPVPCPVCGHYQRFMFPKLIGSRGMWVSILILLLIAVACLDLAIGLYAIFSYLRRPNDHDLGNMMTTASILVVLCIIGVMLSMVKRAKIRKFDPNLEDQQIRIEIGRSRAMTRVEFEKAQQGSA